MDVQKDILKLEKDLASIHKEMESSIKALKL